MKRNSEAIWTTLLVAALSVITLIYGFPGSMIILFMALIGYGLLVALVDFVKVLDPEWRQFAVTPIRRHILALGVGAIGLVAWSTLKVDPLPSGSKLDMEAVRETTRAVGVGVLTGLIAGGVIAAAQTRFRVDSRPIGAVDYEGATDEE